MHNGLYQFSFVTPYIFRILFGWEKRAIIDITESVLELKKLLLKQKTLKTEKRIKKFTFNSRKHL